MANQNFRVKNGINVGTAVTITTSEFQVGDTRIHTSGIEVKSINVSSGVSTFTNLVVSAGSTSAPSISPTGDSNTGIFFPSPDTITFTEGGVEALRITSSGDIGIATTNPQGSLEVVNTVVGTGVTTVLRVRQSSSNTETNFGAKLELYGTRSDGQIGRYGAILGARQNRAANNDGYLAFFTGNGDASQNEVERVRVTSTGNVEITNGNLVFSTAGKGIDFSATANSSGTMTSELLDDYEEGTWTPGISGSSGGSYTAGASNVGWYRKIGKMVFIGGTLNWTAQVTPYSGNLTLTGLPFASTTVSNARSGGGLGAVSSGLTFTAGYNSWTIVVDPGGNTFGYIIQVSSTGSGYSHNPTVGASGIVYGFFGSYATN